MGTAHGAGSTKQLLTALLLLLVAMIILLEVMGLGLLQGSATDADNTLAGAALPLVAQQSEDGDLAPRPLGELLLDQQPGGRRTEIASGHSARSGREGESTGTITGRVVDPVGNPIAGVGLTAVEGGLTWPFSVDPNCPIPDVTIAFELDGFHRVSDDSGHFEMVGIEPGIYGIQPQVTRWIALPLKPSSAGMHTLEVRAGGSVNVGDLVVIPAELLRVHVVDKNGEPVENARVELEPMAIDVPGIAASELDNGFNRWLNGEDSARAYSSSVINYTTSSFAMVSLGSSNTGASGQLSPDGYVLLRATKGTWKLSVLVDLNRPTGPDVLHERVIHLPRELVEIVLPISSTSIAGRAVDHGGQPLSNVLVVALTTRDGSLDGPRVLTDEGGGFEFELLSENEPRWLHFSGGGILGARRELEPGIDGLSRDATAAGELPTYRLRRSASLSVRLDTNGKIPAVAPLHIRALHLEDPGIENSDNGWNVEEVGLARDLRLNEITSDALIKNERELVINDLLPGTYEVSLWLGHGTGDFVVVSGSPVLDMRLWQKGLFVTGDPEQVFEINLRGYEEPARQPSERVEFQVKNAATGALVPQAWIALSGDQWSRSGWSNTKGLCAFHIPDLAFTAKVSQSGFGFQTISFAAPSGIPSRIGLELQPTQSVVAFTLQSKFGESIPEVSLRFFDEDGQSVLGRLEGKREWRDGGLLKAPYPLVLLDIPAGRLRVEVTIGKVSFGSQWTEIQETGERQDIPLVLKETLAEVRTKIRATRE